MSAAPADRTYYEAVTPRPTACPPLQGTVSCDVCVVGAGLSGCSAALHLAERGYRVVLLEAGRIASGASGRNGGQALAGTSASQGKLERLSGREGARAVWDLSLEGLDLVRTLIDRYRIACDWRSGHLLVAIRPRQEAELHGLMQELGGRYGYGALRYVPGEELRSMLATQRYRAALYDSRSGHLNPLAYTLGLAAAAQRAGAQIFEHTRALDFSRDGPPTLRTPQGTVHCQTLVLCADVHSGALAPELRAKQLAVGTCIVSTAPLGAERAARLIANDACVADMNWVLDYFRLSPDTRLLFGGRVTYSGFDPMRIAASTRRRMLGVFPQLSDLALEYAWGGYIGITLNRAPHFGRLTPRIYFMQGYSGQGLVMAGLAGKLVAEAVAGQAERFDVFARIPHAEFPGGPLLRRPALVLAMLYYRLRDLL